MAPARVALSLRKEIVSDTAKDQLLSLTKEGVIRRDGENGGGKHPATYDSYQIIRPSDLIFCLFDMDETPRTVGLVREHGMISGAYTRFEPTKAVDPEFICWYFIALDDGKRLRPLYTGLRKVIQKSRFLSAPMPIPPLATQVAISRFLNWETAQIDKLIAKQERLIELLAEKRQAIITQAVTKGLDPAVPTKPSAIPWLGDVPTHWSIGRIKDSVDSAVNGTWGFEPGESEFDVWCVRVADFDRISRRVGRQKMTFRSVTKDDLKRRQVRRGDLLLEKSGGGEKSPVGFVVEYDHDDIAVCSNFVTVLRIHAGANTKFWKYVHASNYSHRITERSIKQSTGIQNLDQASYFNEAVGVPPAPEQAEISQYLDVKCAVIDSAAESARKAIVLLKERRSALIFAAVTGKIDVREGAA